MADEEPSGITRRQLGRRALALGGTLAFASLPAGPVSAASPAAAGSAAAGGGHPTLRRGPARRAGLLAGHLDRLATDAEAFLGPSPEHPWYAGAVLLAGRGGTVALHRPIGMAVRYQAYDERTDTGVEFPADRQIPMTEDTVFDLASVSKLFTSVLAVQQIERGTLELEAAVASYLPDFGRAGKAGVTLRHLLTHTSGFRAWIPLYKAPTHEERVRLVLDEAPVSAPGTAYLYSDLNLISLQLVLEKVTGRSLDVLLREEITGPWAWTAPATTRPPPGNRGSPPPRTPARPGPASTGGWCGARCTTRTPTAWAGSRATRVCSPAPGIWRSSAGPCSTAAATAGRASSDRSRWS